MGVREVSPRRLSVDPESVVSGEVYFPPVNGYDRQPRIKQILRETYPLLEIWFDTPADLPEREIELPIVDITNRKGEVQRWVQLEVVEQGTPNDIFGVSWEHGVPKRDIRRGIAIDPEQVVDGQRVVLDGMVGLWYRVPQGLQS